MKNPLIAPIVEDNLKDLFRQTYNEEVASFIALPTSGSERHYFRIKSDMRTVIGVRNNDEKENIAFISFTRSFKKLGLNVPSVLACQFKQGIYLLQDLGDVDLFSTLFKDEKRLHISEEVIKLYKQSLIALIQFQIAGNTSIDYSVCYPRKSFDRQSMQWDLNYFKYYFLKLKCISFDEQALENDFTCLINYLLEAPSDYFMYRDFQARNVMIYKDAPWFIDYQGGRKGPLQYDLASLLFQAKADLPFDLRDGLLNYYLDELEKHIEVERRLFKEYYFGFILIRTLQVLGAYGFRGYFQRKKHFIESIKYALKTVDWLIKNYNIPIDLNELKRVMAEMIQTK